jgi:tol-pal system protein YbgF
MLRQTSIAITLMSALLAAGPARAALFEDDEARKAILDLRARVQNIDEQQKARLTEQSNAAAAASAQLTEQIAALRRSLLDLNAQLENLRAEMARMRGQDEQLTRDVAELQRKQKDLAQGVDERVRKLEPKKVTLDGIEFMADADETRQYTEAMTTLRNGDFDKAVEYFGGFVRRFPTSGYVNPARFWLGNALYGKRSYKEAIVSFRGFVDAAPEHPRAAEALLAIANCQVEMKDVKSARRTIGDLMKAYPDSEAAAAGKQRLATLKG